jgi:hypothetical protein
MNHTKSGLISVGAPNSSKRLEGELNNALENDLCLLLLTDEGLEVSKRFARIEGCDWDAMTKTGRAELLKTKHAWKFFAGVLCGLEHSN